MTEKEKRELAEAIAQKLKEDRQEARKRLLAWAAKVVMVLGAIAGIVALWLAV